MTELDFTKSEQYVLSIRLSADGFSFYIHHPNQENDCVFMSYAVNPSYSLTANIKEMITSTEALKHTYKKVNILIETSRFTFIPFDLFEDEHIDQLFYHNFPKINNEIVLCNILGKSNVVILFGKDKHAHQLLSESFPTARFFADTSPLIEYFTLKSREGNNRKLYTYFRKDSVEIYAFDRGKLLLSNSFTCKHYSDQIYYLLYTWQQLGYSQEKDQLCLCTLPSQKEDLLAELRKFLRQVTVLQLPNPSLPFDLQTLLICE